MKKFARILTVFAMVTLVVQSARGEIVTLDDNVVGFMTNGTFSNFVSSTVSKDYTFNGTGALAGENAVIRLTATFGTPPAAGNGIRSIDGNQRISYDNSIAGDANERNHVETSDGGLVFSSSVQSSTAGIDAANIGFRIDGLGLRHLSSNYGYTSSAGTNLAAPITTSGEVLIALDASFDNANSYLGTLTNTATGGQITSLTAAGGLRISAELLAQPPAVPEPSTHGLAAFGLLSLGMVGRRRRRR